MQAAQTSPTVRSGSLVLWDTWFDSGMAHLQAADTLRLSDPCLVRDEVQWKRMRRMCGNAGDWFRQAIQQAVGFPDNHHRLCISKGGLAWAGFWRDEKDQANACATEALACINVQQKSPSSVPGADAAHVTLAIARSRYILGVFAFDGGQYSTAIEHFRKCIESFTALNVVNPDVANSQLRLAEALWHCRQFQEAIVQIQRAETSLPTTMPWNAIRADYIATLADWLMLDGQYRQATLRFPRWDEATKDSAKNTVERSLAEVEQRCNHLVIFSRAFLMQGDLSTADKLLTQAEDLSACGTSLNPELQLALATQRASWYRWSGLLAQARKSMSCLNETSVTAPLTLLRACLVRAEIEYDAGQYEEALRFFAAAETHLVNIPDACFTDRIQICLGISRIKTAQSLLTGAAERAGAAFRELETSGRLSQPEAAFALHDLAMSFLRDNKNEESWPLANRAVELVKASLGPQHPVLVTMLNTKAEIAWSLGGQKDPQTIGSSGFQLCEESQQLAQKLYPSRYFDMARSSSIHGRLLHFRGCIRHAEAEFKCSLAQWDCAERMLGAAHPEKSWTILAMATLYAGLDRTNEAEDLLLAVEALMLEMKLNKDSMGYEFNRLGNLHYEASLFKEALWLYSHALDYYKTHFGEGHPHTQQAAANLKRAIDKLTTIKD